MCGLVGAVAKESGRQIDEQALRRAMAALRHRGPDGEGLWRSPDGEVGLGHTRLGVIDILGGSQPIISEDGGVVLVANGEFYDFERIRGELSDRGHRFRTGTDSEIALHLYEDHGADCLRYLRGEFSFLIWDQRDRSLLAARDRFGVRPLCYAEQDGVLYLASEAKALFAAGVRAAWDEASFFHAACLQYLLPERTLFSGVRQLPPGHLLKWRDGHVQVRRYWDMNYPMYRGDGDRGAGRSEADLATELRERLDEAVRLRLRADVPVCFQLSGGLDSSAVVGLAARHAERPLPCFTVSFAEDAGYDELPIARETADHVGAVLHTLRLTPTDLMTHLPDAVAQGEGLAINGHISAKYLLSRMMRDAGFKVVLTGEGADEILGGYAHLRRDLLLAGAMDGGDLQARLDHLNEHSQVTAGIHLPEGRGLSMDAARRVLGYVPSFLAAKGTLGWRNAAVLAGDLRRQFHGRDSVRVLLDDIDVDGQLRGRHPVDQSAYLWTKLSLAGYILRTLGDGMEMAHAIEGRLPFLDTPFFEFVRDLPIWLKIRGQVEKYILREAMGPLLTDTVRRRPKHPFMAPPMTSTSAPGANAGRAEEMLQDLLRGPTFAGVPFYDRAAVLLLLDRLPAMTPRERVATDPVLMMAASTCILHERYRL